MERPLEWTSSSAPRSSTMSGALLVTVEGELDLSTAQQLAEFLA